MSGLISIFQTLFDALFSSDVTAATEYFSPLRDLIPAVYSFGAVVAVIFSSVFIVKSFCKAVVR